jgi:hypothetical protein
MKRLMGHQQLWILDAALKESKDKKPVALMI